MKVLLHNVYKIINLWYPTYVYQFFNFPYNYKNTFVTFVCLDGIAREFFAQIRAFGPTLTPFLPIKQKKLKQTFTNLPTLLTSHQFVTRENQNHKKFFFDAFSKTFENNRSSNRKSWMQLWHFFELCQLLTSHQFVTWDNQNHKKNVDTFSKIQNLKIKDFLNRTCRWC